jgi:hypothetical protein
LVSDFTNKEEPILEDLDFFVVSDTEILSLSFFKTKISLAIIEIEKRNNELEKENEEQQL